MARYANTLEGGTNGVAVSTGNSGGTSGNAFTYVTPAAPVFDSARAAHGSMSIRIPAGEDPCYVQWEGAGWGSTAFAACAYFYFSAASGQDHILLRANSSGGTLAARVMINSARKLVLQYNNGSTVTAWTSTESVPLNQWIRIEFYVVRSATVGEIRAAFYPGDSVTATDSYASAATLNTGTAAITIAPVGKFFNGTFADFWIDNPVVETAATGFIGPPVNNPPTGTITANQTVAAAAAVTATVSATDADGSIASYAWTVVSGASTSTPALTGASTATVSLTAPAAGNLVTLQCVVGDDAGGTLTLTTEVRVPLTSGDLTTLALTGTGDPWTNTGGAATDGAALADASDTTYSESGDYTIVASERRWRLRPTIARTSLILTLRGLVTATGGTVKARLYEGATLRQEWTITPGTSVGDHTLTVTSPGAISDWGNLWVAAVVVA